MSTGELERKDEVAQRRGSAFQGFVHGSSFSQNGYIATDSGNMRSRDEPQNLTRGLEIFPIKLNTVLILYIEQAISYEMYFRHR